MITDRGYKCRITNIVPLSDNERLFLLRIVDPVEREMFNFRPGQFLMLEVPGYGEAPISISSSTSNHEFIELCIRRAGHVTSALFETRQGAMVSIRGPFGTSFPMELMEGKNVLMVVGGLGIAPMRAPLFWIGNHRDRYLDVRLLFGAKDPSQLLFDYQFEGWQRVSNVKMHTIVEHADESWKGRKGLITALFDEFTFDAKETYAIVCGPPVMFKFVCHHLDLMGIPMNRMFVSLERRMHCGMGKCCRCMVGSTFTCLDGPVFDYWSVLNLKEAI
ncbi:MAG: oxidoreductase [Chlorobiaceae bacterium]|nr:oxidoreductase [Chlorobiaceae bacterium]NTW74880.1 oxidoreductase [Chlorobiaceae bacterium]